VAGFVLPLRRAADVLNHDQSVHLLDKIKLSVVRGSELNSKSSAEFNERRTPDYSQHNQTDE
jgi:hypothetical protein